MSIFTNYRKTMNDNRDMNTENIKQAIDCLKEKEGTDESREALANSAKEVLDSYVELETINNKLEYSTGRLAGMAWAIGAQVIGFAVGKGIEYLINKNK